MQHALQRVIEVQKKEEAVGCQRENWELLIASGQDLPSKPFLVLSTDFSKGLYYLIAPSILLWRHFTLCIRLPAPLSPLARAGACSSTSVPRKWASFIQIKLEGGLFSPVDEGLWRETPPTPPTGCQCAYRVTTPSCQAQLFPSLAHGCRTNGSCNTGLLTQRCCSPLITFIKTIVLKITKLLSHMKGLFRYLAENKRLYPGSLHSHRFPYLLLEVLK